MNYRGRNRVLWAMLDDMREEQQHQQQAMPNEDGGGEDPYLSDQFRNVPFTYRCDKKAFGRDVDGSDKVKYPSKKKRNNSQNSDNGSRSLGEKFVQMDLDVETQEFMCRTENKSFGRLSLESLGFNLLAPFVSKTSVNGILCRGSMFVLSSKQIFTLLAGWSRVPLGSEGPFAPCNGQVEVSDSPLFSLLDVGAGDGGITEKFEPLVFSPMLCRDIGHTCAEDRSGELRQEVEGESVASYENWLRNYERLMEEFERLKKDRAGVYGEGKKKSIFATETNPVMVKRLIWKGYNCEEKPSLENAFGGNAEWARLMTEAGGVDLVCCFNVLDRCEKPISLLRDLRKAVKCKGDCAKGDGKKRQKDDDEEDEDGRVILAVVLPWSPFVENGTGKIEPVERININCYSSFTAPNGKQRRTFLFERTVTKFVQDVLTPNGFAVESFCRVPYLCEGDLVKPYYWLDNVVFCLKPTKLL
eukprot:Nk52_evm14s147 gene=Nk52_evmTU14s147